MTCPALPNYAGTEIVRPTVIAALLAADQRGVIPPADGERWFSRDLNELHSRGLAYPYQMRCDRQWWYRLTEAGRCVAESFAEEGYEFDGWDAWKEEELLR